MYPKISASRIQQAVEEAKSFSIHAYPWDDIASNAAKNGTDYFWLAGYGSLLSQGSAARTIDASDRARREPVMIFGAKRQYSYRFPAAFLKSRYNKTGNFAALDSKATYDANDRFNAIITRVYLEDLDAFRKREFAYDLKPVPAFRWNAPDEKHRIAYTLDCPPQGPSPDHPFTKDSPPLSEYHQICRDGAAEISTDFRDCFLETTFLGDGKTPISAWEAQSGFLTR